MADTNLNTSIAALKTEILNAIPTATVDELLSLARSAKGMNLGEDTQIETAINSRANTLTASATTSEVIKLASAIKQVLNPAAITVTNISSVTGHLIPDADDTHDLGSASNKFRELYLSGNSINLGNQTISSSSTGIIVPEIQVGTGTNNVKLTANSDGELVQTGTNSSGQQQDPTQGGGGGASVVTNISDLPTSGNTAGAQALVTATNTVFMWTGTAWYKIATMTNESPTAITGVNATYTLATDGTPTVITAVSSDPEGATLSWSYAVSSGALNGTTVSQGTGANTNQFTVTPHASQGATFDLTFSVTDNVNGAVTSSSSFTLSFNAQPFTRTLEAFVTSTNTSYYSNFGLFGDFAEDKYILGAVEDNKAILYNATDNTVLNTFTESPNGSSSRFGECAISANYIAVSAYNSGPNSGAPTYGQTGTIYIYDASNYNAVTNFQTFGSGARAMLGYNIGFTQNGNYLVATAPRVNFGSTTTGKVVVYDANNSWSATQISSPFTGPFADSNAGYGIGVTDTYFAIGSPNYDSGSYNNDGRVDIFNATPPFAHFRTLLPATLSGVGNNFYFGYSVDAWDDYVIIGNFNKAWIYRMSTGAFIVDLSTLATGQSNSFGKSVGIGPNGAVVGDTGNDQAFFFDISDIDNGNVTANGTRARYEYTPGVDLNDFSDGIKVSKVSDRVSIGTYYPQISGSNTASRAYIYS